VVADLVLYLARQLVTDPEAVRLEESEGPAGELVLRLHVAEDDRGMVIGRGGRMVSALRDRARSGARGDCASCRDRITTWCVLPRSSRKPAALEAVLADVAREHVDAIAFGGDIAAGPFPRTVGLVRSLDTVCIRGNADRLDAAAEGEWEDATLDQETGERRRLPGSPRSALGRSTSSTCM
jgi:predicted RNA-binding protein YlqC (UPF0109 family)